MRRARAPSRTASRRRGSRRRGDDVTEPAAKGEALPEVLTVEQAAALLQLSPKTVKRLAQRGGVPGRRVGNQWRFPRGALMDWVAGGDP